MGLRTAEWKLVIAVFRVVARRACASGPVGPHSEEDLVQLLAERLLSRERHLLESFDNSRGEGAMTAYFRLYAKRRILDQRKKYATRALLDEEYRSMAQLPEPVCPHLAYEGTELTHIVWVCVGRLREDLREIFYARFVDRLEYKEIAALMSVRLSKIYRLKDAALQQVDACIRNRRSDGPKGD